LPQDFNRAASVGRFDEHQAAAACSDAESKLNLRLKEARGKNAYTPEQLADFHCAQASVHTHPPHP
jgi:hypothetical protein